MDAVDKCKKWHNRECPRCKKKFSGYPALSRVDNETEICSDCGVEEAIEQFIQFFPQQLHIEQKLRA